MGLQYRRVILKVSGEMLGEGDDNFAPARFRYLIQEIQAALQLGAQLGIVVGGGNVFRGRNVQHLGVHRVTGDAMGMLGTVINALALADLLEQAGVPASVLAAREVEALVPRYHPQKAREALEAGRVVLLAGGTGNPFFTTDTAAALRAAELQADAVLKATKVRGVFTGDPETDPSARFLPELTFQEMIERRLRVVDLTAATLLLEARIPLVVFALLEPGTLVRVLQGERVGTLVKP